MASVGWFVKHLVLPLSPFIIGALIRTIYAGDISVESLSPGELTFSVAMLSLLMAAKCSQLTNQDLRSALTSLFQLGVIVFLALFAWSIFIEIDIANSMNKVWEAAQSSVQTNKPIQVEDLPERVPQLSDILNRLRWTALAASGLVVPLTVYAVNKYNLQEL